MAAWIVGVVPAEGAILSDQVFLSGQLVINAPEVPGVSEFFPAFAPAPGLVNGAVVLIEGIGASAVVSDQLWVQNGQFYFASDPDLQNLGPNGFNIPVVGTLVENGQPQDVSQYFHDVTGAPLPPGTIAVASDVDAATPEPGTITVWLVLFAFGIGCWRKRKAAL